MSHKGKMVPWTVAPFLTGTLLITGPHSIGGKSMVRGSGVVCDACGEWGHGEHSTQMYHSAAYCEKLCQHCMLEEGQHAGGRCLFSPTRFKQIVYAVRVEKHT